MIALDRFVMAHLHSHACNAINQSHDDAFHEIAYKRIRRTQWENIFTAHLCRAMHHVAHKWKTELTKALPSVGLSMASVFTHQTPYVKWTTGNSNNRCELADVLLVLIDRMSGNPEGVAVLIQAKLSATGGITLSSLSEKRQFDLLSTRPIFDVDALVAPTQIDLRHLSPDAALMFGLTSYGSAPLPSLHSGIHHWLTADGLFSSAGTYTVSSKDCLAYVLTGMLVGTFGWKFDLPAKGGDWKSVARTVPRDDWSTLINYLLEETFSKPLSATYKTAMGRAMRGQEDLLFMTADSPSGLPMFFLGYDIENSFALQQLSQRSSTEIGNWKPGHLEDGVSISDGGNSTNGGNTPGDEDPPERGPISAILFDIGPQG